jgi:LytTr DNA-binding domain
MMNESKWWQHPVVRNILGLSALLLVYYIPDRFALQQREGFKQGAPYLLIIGLYAWIVFHNRYLFDRLYLTGRKRQYLIWTALFMIGGSINMYLVIVYGFGDYDTLPQILSFWIFTVTGLGIHVLYRYRSRFAIGQDTFEPPPTVTNKVSHFIFVLDGKEHQVPVEKIQYVESLENYVRLITTDRIYLIRLSMKEAETKLPRPMFLRISRSHIINTNLVSSIQGDSIRINNQDLKIGKVYKRFVEEQLALRKSLI